MSKLLLAAALVLLSSAGMAQPVEKAGFGPSRTLQDVARERRLGVRGVSGGTFSVAGASGMPVLILPVYGEGGSFEEVDRSDAAHRPAPATAYTAYDPYLPNFYPNGYGGTRTHFRPQHSAPAPSVSRAPAPATRAPAARAPRVSSGRWGR